MMSWEAVFSLLFCSVLIGYLLLTFNAYQYDTTLYEYQLANDFAEVVYKSDVGFFTGDFNDLLDNLSADSGYCIYAEEVGMFNTNRTYITKTCNNKYGDYTDANTSVVSVKRRIPGLVPGLSVKYYVWVG